MIEYITYTSLNISFRLFCIAAATLQMIGPICSRPLNLPVPTE